MQLRADTEVKANVKFILVFSMKLSNLTTVLIYGLIEVGIFIFWKYNFLVKIKNTVFELWNTALEFLKFSVACCVQVYILNGIYCHYNTPMVGNCAHSVS